MSRGSSEGSSSGSCDSVPRSACHLLNHRDDPASGPGAPASGDLAPGHGAPASSPSVSLITKPRGHVARPVRFDMSRITWPPELTDFFITALVDECRAGNRPHKTLNQQGKENIVKRISDRTGSRWTWDACKNKWDDLKKKWSCWKRLNQYSGLGRDPRTGVIKMSEQWWAARIQENPVAKVFKRTVLEREEDLDYIFANMEPRNFGPNEDGGHEDGRAGVPTQYLESDNSEDVPNDEDAVPHDDPDVPMPHITPSPPLPRRTGSASSKRKRSDPISSSVNFWDNLENTFDHISERKIQKFRDSLEDSSKDAAIKKKEEDDADYMALMQELLDGGVDPWSTEYMMATEVLLDVTRRGAYRILPSVAAKRNWIKHIYVMTKGQPPSV